MQRVQASILNDITETKTFDEVKNAPELKNTQGRESNIATHQRQAVQVLWGRSYTQTMPSIWDNVLPHVARWGSLGRCVGANETMCSA